MTGCEILAPEVSRSILEGADEEGSGLRLAREWGYTP